MVLLGWTVIDAQGQKTDVKLGALTTKATLDPQLVCAARSPTGLRRQ